jgi:hypothetical protein
VQTFNEVYSSLSTQRRYEVWFVRFGLADGSGAWWFRYLLMNPGRGGCPGDPLGMPVQVWATWFPRDGRPQSFIQGYPLRDLNLSPRKKSPFHFRVSGNEIDENSCRGAMKVDGHDISWNLHCRSTFRVTLSNKGWIGSDAAFSGQVIFDGQMFSGDPLGFGVQGHNCGYRHRDFWTWAHAYFPRRDGIASTLEALVYDMPFGFLCRKAVLWHESKQHVFRDLREMRNKAEFSWNFASSAKDGLQMEASFEGGGSSVHRLPYMKTNCSGSFEVANNSLANARVCLRHGGGLVETLETSSGAVLEMAGERD